MKKVAYNFLSLIWETINVRNIANTLTVDGFSNDDDNCLFINKADKELYCLELVGSGNTPSRISQNKINTFFEDYKKDKNAHFMTAFVNDPDNNFQRVYIFGNNKDLLTLISKDLDVPFLNALEVLNVLFDVYLDNSYYVKNKLQHRDINLSEQINYGYITETFNKLVKDSVYKNFNDLNVYQAYKFRQRVKRVDLTRLFQLKWHGVIWTYTDFSSGMVESVLKDRITQGLFAGYNKNFKDLRRKYRANEIELAVRHSVVFLKNGNKTVVSEIGDILNTNYRERSLFNKKLLQFTPLKFRDKNWDNLIDKDFLKDSISVVHKQTTGNANFYGKDINGSHIDFNFSATTASKRNKSSNFLMLGVIGSGKTTNLNGMIGQTVGYRLGDEKAKELDSQNFRIFDIKKSCYTISKKLSEVHPDDVFMMDASLGKFAYNPINVSFEKRADGKININENELAMNILLLSIALEAKSNNSKDAGLNTAEQGIFKDAVKHVFASEYEGETIRFFKDSHPDTYKKLKDLGYADLTKTHEIKESGFDFIKVPTLDIITTQVDLYTDNPKDEIRAQNAKTLFSKLKDIASIGIFSGYDKFDIKSVKYLYMDFDNIKGTDEFIPVFLAMFNKLFTIDKYNQRKIESELGRQHRPYITYIFEEAFNLFSNPSFELYLKKFVNESRSDRIKAGFILQIVKQVPDYVLDQVENKFFLFPSANKRTALIDEIEEVLKPNKETVELFNKVPEYGIALWNEHNTSAFLLDMTPEEIEFYGQDQ